MRTANSIEDPPPSLTESVSHPTSVNGEVIIVGCELSSSKTSSSYSAISVINVFVYPTISDKQFNLDVNKFHLATFSVNVSQHFSFTRQETSIMAQITLRCVRSGICELSRPRLLRPPYYTSPIYRSISGSVNAKSKRSFVARSSSTSIPSASDVPSPSPKPPPLTSSKAPPLLHIEERETAP